ncbi:MAG: DUF3179 domain-containing protein, partial [Fimbriimonadaceae bacterium]|nr:DUF3179 domain-containing protein [Fimbriimonadaceae bacterium]
RVTEFGVSGALIESNMLMYDRLTESLWQQSTGRAVAGEFHGKSLDYVSFQLLTLSEAKDRYPDGDLLTEDTGFPRDYSRDPYEGYEENETFIFAPSRTDDRYPSKQMFVAFRFKTVSVGVPLSSLEKVGSTETEVGGEKITLKMADGEVDIRTAAGAAVPFYLEMWFSWFAQNGEAGVVFDPHA